MIGTVLGISAALAFGVADFVAGFASRKIHFLLVTLAIQAIGAVVACGALALTSSGPPDDQSLIWGAVSGIGSATGTLALYRGLSRGQMSVAAPLSAVGSAAIPAIVGIVLGDRLTPLAIAGVVIALPGIWLVAKPSSGTSRAGTVDGIVAGIGFALLFVALHQAGPSGLWPVAAGQVSALAIITVTVLIARPAALSQLVTAHSWWVLAAGALSITATITYFYATHVGLLTIAAVLTSIYPGFTVALAVLLLRERPARLQLAGLITCGIAITAITIG